MPDWLPLLPVPAMLAVLVVVARETALIIGVLLPGSTAALALGALAQHGAVPVSVVLIPAAAAAAAGGQLAYLTGRGHAEHAGWMGRGPRPALTRRHHQSLARLLREHGAIAVVAGQWIVGARTLMPRLAGHTGLPYRRFSAHQLPTASVWAAMLVVSGHGAALTYQRYRVALGATVMATVMAVVVARRLRHRPVHPGHTGRASLVG